MYARKVGGKLLSFEPSGGLIHGALVMQDFESDTYWSLMTGEGIKGKHRGAKLQELAVSTKTQWKTWLKRHPKTLILSVRGRVHIARNPYLRYFNSPGGFRGLKATDTRLATKTSIYAVQLEKRKLAIPFSAFLDGAALQAGPKTHLFVYRPKGASIFRSTLAYRSPTPFQKTEKSWRHPASGAVFDVEQGVWKGVSTKTAAPQRIHGFDTFWYMWSLTHPDTEVLGTEK